MEQVYKNVKKASIRITLTISDIKNADKFFTIYRHGLNNAETVPR